MVVAEKGGRNGMGSTGTAETQGRQTEERIAKQGEKARGRGKELAQGGRGGIRAVKNR